MLRAMELLKNDLKIKDSYRNRIKIRGEILDFYSRGNGIPKGRIIQFSGMPDCGKTSIAKNIMDLNSYHSILYISNKQDNLNKVANHGSVTILKSNVFEDTIAFLKGARRDDIDIVIIDDIHNMLSKEELMSAFTKQLDNREILNKYIKEISILAAQKNFAVILFNGINLISNKSRYGYIIEKEAVASFMVHKRRLTSESIVVDIEPIKNIMSNVKENSRFEIDFNINQFGYRWR